MAPPNHTPTEGRRADDANAWIQIAENKANIAALTERMNRFEGGFERMMEKFGDKIDALATKMETKFDNMETKMDTKFKETEKSVGAVEKSVSDMQSRFKGGWWVIGVLGTCVVGAGATLYNIFFGH